MRYAVTGPRDPPAGTYDLVRQFIHNLPDESHVFHGNAKGVDRMARDLAKLRGLQVTAVEPHYGGKFGDHIAPLIRNAEMVSRVDQLVGFWHGKPYGGTLNTLWVSTKILRKRPLWFLTERCDADWADHIFDLTCQRPEPHWVEAFRLWERSRDQP